MSNLLLTELIKLCPDFDSYWNENNSLWLAEDGSYSIYGLFSVFSSFIADRLIAGSNPELISVFNYVESKLDDHDSEIRNAACTCFLENLMNLTPDKIIPAILIPLLGPKSREFCRAYDKWCGIYTPGL